MKNVLKYFSVIFCAMIFSSSFAQKKERVKFVKATDSKIQVFVGDKLFTNFMYPDTLEKPVLYPIHTANGTTVTRGFPLEPRTGEPTDHPHHIGIWFEYENINGLDFWNNSFAIAADKKQLYGWTRTDKILKTTAGEKGVLSYHANWTNKQKDVLMEETTSYEFSGSAHRRMIDRETVLTATTDVLFTDAKDGFLGMRVARELQIPSKQDQKFTDDKGNLTVVKGGTDNIANGNYITSEGKQGDDAWSTRGVWCKLYGKMGKDSISIAIIDHPKNPNYPTFWHARGYGLFAANPLGEKVFTNGKSEKQLRLKKGESVTFRYRIVIEDGSKTLSGKELDGLAGEFGNGK